MSDHGDYGAEFAAYRQEILARSGHQHTLISLNVTALSAISGVALSGHADERILLLLPIVASSIGLLWWDHARNIERIGDYIREQLPGFDGYERQIARLERAEWRRLPMTVALLVLFVAAPVAGLVVPINKISDSLWILWSVGLALSVVCSFVFVRWVSESFRG